MPVKSERRAGNGRQRFGKGVLKPDPVPRHGVQGWRLHACMSAQVADAVSAEGVETDDDAVHGGFSLFGIE